MCETPKVPGQGLDSYHLNIANPRGKKRYTRGGIEQLYEEHEEGTLILVRCGRINI